MNINSRERVIDNNDSTMDCGLLKYHVIHFLSKSFFKNRNTKFYGAISASQEKDCAK
jgi:hypothetical protein